MSAVPWVEIVGLVVSGGGLGAVGTYFGIRKKTQSDLEIAYMNQLNRASERIDKLESSRDERWTELLRVMKEERAACDARIAAVERKFDERISQLSSKVDDFSESHDDPPRTR